MFKLCENIWTIFLHFSVNFILGYSTILRGPQISLSVWLCIKVCENIWATILHLSVNFIRICRTIGSSDIPLWIWFRVAWNVCAILKYVNKFYSILYEVIVPFQGGGDPRRSLSLINPVSEVEVGGGGGRKQ